MNAIQDTLWYADLTGDSRDGLYRALSYLRRAGWPGVGQIGDELENLQAAGQSAYEWLQTQPENASILDDYQQYCEWWSPVFPD